MKKCSEVWENVQSCWNEGDTCDCQQWDEVCCDWEPCAFFCDTLVHGACLVCNWIPNIVCTFVDVFRGIVCVGWDFATFVANAVFTVIESLAGFVLSAVAFVVEVVEMIPILGPAVRVVVGIFTGAAWTVLTLVDGFLGLLGIRPEKILRVCTIILSDEQSGPVATKAYARAVLQIAANVYKRDANVRLIPLAPFEFTNPFSDARTVTDDWIEIDPGADNSLLDVPCDEGTVWWTTGSKFQYRISKYCFYGAWRRFIGYGAPVTCFIVRTIPGSSGCTLWFTDYVTVQGGDVPPGNPRVVAHELGHSCYLWDLCVDDTDINNLMATQHECSSTTTVPDYGNPQIGYMQALLVRASKHVTYF